MQPFEAERDGYRVSTDPALLDVATIHSFLSERSYWAQGRTLEVTRTAIANSLCFGLYAPDGSQVAFARVVTDYVTFAWLCDVFVLEEHRGQGLGKWLVACVTSHPALHGINAFILATRDAQELYSRYGAFEVLTQPQNWMRRQA